MFNENKPLVYSCSGCSNVAQLANSLAISLNQNGIAEMSCIAGVGGDVFPLVRKAKSERPIIAIDGCPLACVKNCLKRHDIQPTHHFELSRMGIKKEYNRECDNWDFDHAWEEINTVLIDDNSSKFEAI